MSTIRLVLAVALIALALAAPAAAAVQTDQDRTAAALAYEDYLMSYGPPESQPQPRSSDGTPWLPIALGVSALTLVAFAAGGTRHRRRFGATRHTARPAL